MLLAGETNRSLPFSGISDEVAMYTMARASLKFLVVAVVLVFAGQSLSAPSARADAGVVAVPSARPPRSPPTIYLVSPFLLGTLTGADLANLDVAAILPNIAASDWPTITAHGLSADDTSAAIALFQTSLRERVTFTTDNGTQLLPYTSNFLTVPPTPGASTLTVLASQLIPAGGSFYAAALIQAPPVGDPVHAFSAPITVTAQQRRGPPAQAALSLVPPPVVLVHGLWGNLASLANVADYLLATAPWAAYGLVEPICYSIYFAFNADTDPLAGNGNPCEQTSATALSTAIGEIGQTLDGLRIVGGRVDIVAHSMGGLAARSYATTADYNAPATRFRTAGAFHQIVTIDTPEAGSSLATYLIANASQKFVDPLNKIADLLWFGAGCDASNTIETCFANPQVNLPLTAPGYPLNVGVVYSLEPGGAAIASVPVSIPNTIMAAVAAVWPDQGQPETSLLRNELNGLIRGITPPLQSATTTDQQLGNQPNDVIVTQDSQLQGVATGQYQVFTDLAHTGAADSSILGPIVGGSDSNVLNSTDVNQAVGCLLASEGQAASCATATASAAGAQLPPAATATAYQRIPTKFRAPERLAIGPIAGATLGQSLQIPLRLSATGIAAGIAHVVVSEADLYGEVAGASGPAVIQGHGASSSLEVVPLRLGRVSFTVAIWFGDGGFATQSMTADVEPPPQPPLSFSANDLPAVVVTLGSAERLANLHPRAAYPNISGFVAVPATLLHYALLPGEGPPPVRIGPNGVIRAIQPGKAMIEVRFGSAVDRIPIIVRQPQ
jgi:pimeloyl-ACP methyl ester carboxylesterase